MTPCGCHYFQNNGTVQYLPQVSLKTHATVLSSISRTVLTQTFTNPSNSPVKEVVYTFPLYNGVSVVDFTCQVGDRVLYSEVKTKKKANQDYTDAVSKGQSAAIFDHSESASDVFTIRLGNVPAGEQVVVNLTFVGELKQDVQADGVRYTIPNSIAPRYGGQEKDFLSSLMPSRQAQNQGISIVVDVLMEKPSVIREIQSPSHPIKVSLGRISSDTSSVFEPHQASARLQISKGNAMLERDFIIVVNSDGQDQPHALLEEHPTIPGQKALLTTLVPKFNLPPIQPEIVFVIDQSGSMIDKIPTLQSALRAFLKSLPVGICFNICSFGSSFSFLWDKSIPYDKSSLDNAMLFVEDIGANMGGTEMQGAVEAAVGKRLKGKQLEVMILTDGEIWDQDDMFSFVRKSAADNKTRFFSLGIGDAASHSLIEGIAKAGNGFSQSVIVYEELSKKVVRMLKGALSPHIYDYKIDVEYDAETESGFEMIDSETEVSGSDTSAKKDDEKKPIQPSEKAPISLFDPSYKEPEIKSVHNLSEKLPNLSTPDLVQAPCKIPTLYPHVRTTICILMSPQLARNPQALILRASSEHGPLLLKIPIQNIGKGETIHQVASRKAVIELEEGHGWINDARDSNGIRIKNYHPDMIQKIATRECQTLGIKYQVTGKHCSFVALEQKGDGSWEETKVSNLEDLTPAPASPYQVPLRTCSTAVPTRGPPANALFCSARDGFSPGSPLYAAASASVDDEVTNAGSQGFESGAVNCAPGDADLYASFSPMVKTGGVRTREGGGKKKSARKSVLIPTSQHAQPTRSNPQPTSTLDEIIKLQTFEGTWEWTAQLFTLLGLNLHDTTKKLNTEVKKYTTEPRFLERTDISNVIATMLVLEYLERKKGSEKSVWELMQQKAEGWLQMKLGQMGGYGTVIEHCRGAIAGLI